jgi:hypothetical protein
MTFCVQPHITNSGRRFSFRPVFRLFALSIFDSDSSKRHFRFGCSKCYYRKSQFDGMHNNNIIFRVV